MKGLTIGSVVAIGAGICGLLIALGAIAGTPPVIGSCIVALAVSRLT
jgi:hypothetical protein